MFKDILKQIWKNIYIRTILISFSVLIVFLLVYKSRESIYNSFDRFFRGATFDDPYTWSGNYYGFSENEPAAIRLFRAGLEDLIEEAADIYDQDEPEVILKNLKNLHSDWQSYLTQDSLKLVQMMFQDMQLFCDKDFVNIETMSNRWEKEEKLKSRHLKSSADRKKNPFDYALDAEKYHKLLNNLLSLDFNTFSLASEKKPDAWAVLTYRATFYETICRYSKSAHLFQKSLDYFEYKTEKKILFADKEPENRIIQKVHPDALYEKLHEQLKKNKEYHRLLRAFFYNAFRATSDYDWKMKMSEKTFQITNEKDYANRYLETALLFSRFSSIKSNKANFKKLLNEIDYKGIEFEPLYIYSLAEIAFRAGYYKKSRTLVNHITRQALVRQKSQAFILRNSYRLSFMLSLMGF